LPELYASENYEEFYEDDNRILGDVRDYFDAVIGTTRRPVHGIDVGTGGNLYPAFSMLPHCETVTLFERSRANRRWLVEQCEKFSVFWEPYWNMFAKRPSYRSIEPREAFARKAKVRPGDIFRPPGRTDRWGMGTMFFVAESITRQENEFIAALRNFIRILKPGAPFAAAFMRESTGYRVGCVEFPAVSINEVDVEFYLRPRVEELIVYPVRSAKPLREGYSGMILALGRKGRNPLR
jgi:hypothetical protein